MAEFSSYDHHRGVLVYGDDLVHMPQVVGIVGDARKTGAEVCRALEVGIVGDARKTGAEVCRALEVGIVGDDHCFSCYAGWLILFCQELLLELVSLT